MSQQPPVLSWGHRIRDLDRAEGYECSGPGCRNKPRYTITFETKAGTRTLHYCYEHARKFAHNFRVRMPDFHPDPRRINLARYTSSDLEILNKRVGEELVKRAASSQISTGEIPEDILFAFNETGPDEQGKAPYCARLYWDSKKAELARYFFKLEKRRQDGRLIVSGNYSVQPGRIVEKRLGDEGAAGEDIRWLWYLITSDGEEVPVAMPFDEERRNLVIAYLRKEVRVEELLKNSKDS